METKPGPSLRARMAAFVALSCAFLPCAAVAVELVDSIKGDLHLDFQVGAGAYHSQRNYQQSGTQEEGSSTWQEGYVKLGLRGARKLSEGSELYGVVSALGKSTFGDGDPAGWTKPNDSGAALSEAYVGWRSGDMFPALGKDGVHVTAGRRRLFVGDGFLIAKDSLSLGRDYAGGAYDRGGVYYLAPENAFAQTAAVRLGGEQGLVGEFMWLKSNNPGQARPEFAVATLMAKSARNLVGASYIEVLDTDSALDSKQRKGVKTYSLRTQGDLGVENLFFSAEYAHQRRHSGNERAWYGEVGWTFADLPGEPSINYRYSYFSERFDPLLYGNVRSLGTWVQGELAGNYAGPFNSNTKVHHVNLKVSASDSFSVGMLAYRFSSLNKALGRLDGYEIDLYAEWVLDSFYVMPAIGWYKPKYDAAQGGTQIGGAKGNLWGMLLVTYTF
ncbi:hypothetical protein [Pusillimonas sp.]|uniref:hypothetical protein n=1 Tax=Pusillimonas sp. TaxID=3040095 RepID=UPI0037C89210